MRVIHTFFYTTFFWCLMLIMAFFFGIEVRIPFGGNAMAESLPMTHNIQEASAFDALNLPHRHK